MKKLFSRLFFVFLLVLVFPVQHACASKLHALDRACRRDSCLHVAATYGLTLTGAEFLYRKGGMPKETSLLYSAGAVLLLGILKEIFVDEFWDGRDISSNLVGAAAGAGVFYILEF